MPKIVLFFGKKLIVAGVYAPDRDF